MFESELNLEFQLSILSKSWYLVINVAPFKECISFNSDHEFWESSIEFRSRSSRDFCCLAFCDEESENEGKVHSEELRQYTCCARHEKMIDVGYGERLKYLTIRKANPAFNPKYQSTVYKIYIKLYKKEKTGKKRNATFMGETWAGANERFIEKYDLLRVYGMNWYRIPCLINERSNGGGKRAKHPVTTCLHFTNRSVRFANTD